MKRILPLLTGLLHICALGTALAQDASLFTLVNPVPKSCFGSTEEVRVTIRNAGTTTLTSVPVKVEVTGMVTQTLTATYTGSLAPNQTANLLVGQVNMSALGAYQFAAATQLAGDVRTANDALALKTMNAAGAVALPLPTLDFNAFTGSNLSTLYPGWYEARGENYPSEVKDAYWLSSNSAQTGLLGSTTAVIWLSKGRSLTQGTLNQRDWLVSPAFTATPATHLRFKMAITNRLSGTDPGIMGSDDVFKVMLSTDCAATFTPILTIDRNTGLTNALRQFDIDLSSYNGQNIILGMYATDNEIDDPEDFQFYLDDVEVSSSVSGLTERLADAGLRVYPNPAAGIVHLDFEKTVPTGTLELCTLQGQVIKNQVLKASSPAGTGLAFSISDVAPGLYLLRVKSEKRTAAYKIAIRR